jgi:hypothetical protein
MLGLLEFAASSASAQTPEQQVGAVLDDWHQAASVADEARYFGHFAPNGIFMGTDATGRSSPPLRAGGSTKWALHSMMMAVESMRTRTSFS